MLKITFSKRWQLADETETGEFSRAVGVLTARYREQYGEPSPGLVPGTLLDTLGSLLDGADRAECTLPDGSTLIAERNR